MEKTKKPHPLKRRGQNIASRPAATAGRPRKVQGKGPGSTPELIQVSEEKFRRLFEAAQDGIFILDASTGVILEANPSLEKMLGYTRAEMVGKKLWEMGPFMDSPASQEAIKKLQRRSTIRYDNLPLKTKDGQACQVEFVSNVYRADGQKVIQCNIRDITERVRMEKELKAIERRYSQLIEQAGEGIVITAPDGKFLMANSEACRMLGYKEEELLRVNILETYPRGSRKEGKKLLAALQLGEHLHFERPASRKDGSVFWIETSVALLEDGGIQSIIRDITARKQTEQALQESEQKYRGLFENLLEGIGLSKGNHIIAANRALLAIFGFEDLQEFLAIPLLELVSPESRDLIDQRLQRVKSGKTGESHFYYSIIRKDGEKRELEISTQNFTVGDEVYTQSTFRDITERKLAEKALQQTKEYWQSLVENTSDLVTIIDVNGVISYQNQAVERLLGYHLDELVGENAADFIEAEGMARAWEAFGTAVPRKRSEFPVLDIRIRHKDGTWRIMETSGEARLNDAGKLVAVLSSRDITESKQAEEALKESEERFRRMTQVTFEGIVIHDGSRVIDANPAVLAIFGYDFSEVVGKNVLEFVAPESREWILKNIAAKNEKPIDAWGLRKDGTVLPLEVMGKDITYAGSTLRVTALRDITDRKQAEEALHQAEARYRNLVEQMPAVTYLDAINLESSALYFSPQIETLTGYSPAEWEGDPDLWLKLIHPDDSQRVLAENARTNELGEPFRMEYRLISRDGRTVWVRDEAVIISDSAGKPLFWQGILLDITERKRAQVLQEAVYQIAEAAEINETLDELYPRIHQIISSVMPAENFYITLFDEKQNLLRFPYFKDVVDEPFLGEIDPGNGLTAYILRTGRSLLCDETLREKLEQEGAVKTLGVPSKIWLGVPLIIQGKTIGAVVVQHYTDAKAYGEREQQILEFVSSQVASAITRKQAEQDIKNHLADLEAINRISTALRGAKSVNEMLPLLIEETLKIMATDVGEVWLYDSSHRKLHQAISRGWMTGIKEEDLAPGQGIAGHVYQTAEPYTSSELKMDPQVDRAVVSDIPLGWGGICVPIRAELATIGVLCIYVHMPRQLGGEDVRLLTTISEIAGNAIRRIRLYEETLHQVQRLAALRSMDTAISSVMDLRMVLEIFLGHITDQLAVDAADILLLNKPTHTLEFTVGRGFRTSGIEKSHLRLNEGYAGRAAHEKTMVSVRNIAEKGANFLRLPLLEGEDFVTYFGVPLIAKGQVRGVLEIFHRSTLNPEAEWLGFLDTLAGQVAIAIDNSQMYENLQSSNYELMMAYDETIKGWSQAMDMRDRETEGHSQRVTELTVKLAEILGSAPEELIHIHRGALLHDIGKLGVRDDILRKTGPLSEEDWVQMKKHPQFARDMLSPIRYLHPALDIPYCHHEKWDGSGYPRGLKGEEIPLAARIFTVVNVWDALTSDRPYRAAWSREKALAYIREQSSIYFDPLVVDTFLREMQPPKR